MPSFTFKKLNTSVFYDRLSMPNQSPIVYIEGMGVFLIVFIYKCEIGDVAAIVCFFAIEIGLFNS